MCALPAIKRETRRRRERRMYMDAAGARARSNATAIVCKCGPWVRSGPDVSTSRRGTYAPPVYLPPRRLFMHASSPGYSDHVVRTREGTSSCARPGNRLCVTQLIGGPRGAEKPRPPLASSIFSSRFSRGIQLSYIVYSERAKLSNRTQLINAT